MRKGKQNVYILPGIGTGLELRLSRGDDPPPGPALGLELRDIRLGVPGGVIPFPLALLSPIAFTRSFTDTPANSGGRSLMTHKQKFFLHPSILAKWPFTGFWFLHACSYLTGLHANLTSYYTCTIYSHAQLSLLPWRWKQYVPPKCQYTSPK
jgi:hypothetical protein